MSLVVDLPPELEIELAAEAARLSLSLSEYVIRILSNARTQRDFCAYIPRRSSAWRVGGRSPDAASEGAGIFAPRIWTPSLEPV